MQIAFSKRYDTQTR